MARFNIKKLPPHWVYVPSRRQLRDFLGSLAADVRRVDFDGTGYSSARAGNKLLGYLERRVCDGAWCFYLRLWGAPESVVGTHRDELARAAIRAIGQSMTECLVQRAAEVIKPTQLLLWITIGADGVIPKWDVKLVDRYSFSAGCWWAST